jgi:hypothetical protein
MPHPLIHQTDLFHPHGDPDDHFDLATVFALAAQQRLDLRGIVIDYPPPRRRGDPALGAVAQFSRLTGVVAPVAVGTFWRFPHRDVLAGLRDDLKKTLLYMFDQEPSHRWLTYLRRPLDERNWEYFLNHWRNMWSTASLLHAAEQTVTPDGEIVPLEAGLDDVFRFVPITVTCSDGGQTEWAAASAHTAPRRYIFEITDEKRHQQSMTKALGALLSSL